MTFKKTTIFASLMLSSSLVLGACQSDGESTMDSTNNDMSNDIEDNQTGENPANLPGGTYEFSKFELEVDYPDQAEALDVNYEEEKDSTDAEYKSIADNLDVESDDAMAQLRPLLEDLAIKEDMTDDEIIARIVETFEIEDDYTKLEAEIIFLNGEQRNLNVTH